MDYLTFYDFGGFTGTVLFFHQGEGGDGFRFSSYSLGSTPPNVNPADSPAFPNITVYRNTFYPLAYPSLRGPSEFFVTIGSTFGLDYGEEAPAAYQFTGVNPDGTPGPRTGGVANTIGPFQAVQQVPEPETMLMLAAGMLGLGLYRLRTT